MEFWPQVLAAGGLRSLWLFSVLVTVVVASAVIPTVIAQRWFSPKLPYKREHEADALTPARQE